MKKAFPSTDIFSPGTKSMTNVSVKVPQFGSVMVRTYVISSVGVITGEATLGSLKPVVGDQLKVRLGPLALSKVGWNVSPSQTTTSSSSIPSVKKPPSTSTVSVNSQLFASSTVTM